MGQIVLPIAVGLVISAKNIMIYVGIAVHVCTKAFLELLELLDLAASAILEVLGSLPLHPILFVVIVLSFEGRVLLLLDGFDALVELLYPVDAPGSLGSH